MKVWGQIEGAQLEQIAGTTTTPAPTGRIYTDTTNPLLAIPMFYNGTAWVPLETRQSSSLVSQSSGKACTVNWANGLNQQVIISDNCVISFSNPQTGRVHRLFVLNAASSATQYSYKFDMTDQEATGFKYQPMSAFSPGVTESYSWFYSAGVRAAITAIPNPAPATAALATLSTGVDIANNKPITVVYGRTSSPYLSADRLTKNVFSWGAYFTSQRLVPTAITEQARGVAFHPNGEVLFSCMNGSPYIQGSVVDDLGNPGANYANPATLPTGAGQCVAAHPSGSAVAVGHTTTPFMSVYPWATNGGFGVKISNPATVPAAQVNSVAFAPTGDFIAAAGQTTPFLQVWPFTNSFTVPTFGTILSNPASLPTGGPAGQLGKGVAWRPQGDYIALAMTVSPYLYIVAFNRSTGAFGASVTCPTLSGAAVCVQWSKCGNFLLVGTGTSPYLYIYDFSTGSPVAVTNAQGNPAGQVNDMVVTPDNNMAICAVNSTPYYFSILMPQKTKNYLRM